MTNKPYRNKDLLEEQYVKLEKSTRIIAKEMGTTSPTILRWLEKNNIERRTKSEAVLGDKNPMWKGDNIDNTPLHIWLNRTYPRKEVCSKCGKEGKTDYSNKKHEYTRNIDDYQELCRSCHMKHDHEHGFRTSHHSTLGRKFSKEHKRNISKGQRNSEKFQKCHKELSKKTEKCPYCKNMFSIRGFTQHKKVCEEKYHV